MLDSVKSYPLYFVQKASPGEGDAFDFAYIYKFYTERTSQYQRLKYVMRVEAYEDVFAIKFYAARDRKLMTNIIAFFSNDKFYHSDEENASVYMLINRHDCPDIEQKAERIK